MKVLRVGSGKAWTQNMGAFRNGGPWGGNRQLIWTKGNKGESIEMEFSVATGGKRELIVVLTKAVDYGIAQLAVDGKNVGKPIDCYAKTVTTTGEISLGTLDLKEGAHVLTATVIGRNATVKGNFPTGNYLFGIDYLRLNEP